MKLVRRQFLHLTAGAAALPLIPRVASALDYPARPVHLLVGYAAAGPTDISARLIGSWLSQRLGRQFVIENRPGAGTNIATAAVTRAPADGYTLLLVSTANAINATLYSNLDFDFIRDIAPVAGLTRGPSIMVVNPSVPAKTVPEFIAYAKANPGKINMATAGNGSGPHIYGELFKMMAGVDLVPVAYRGAGLAVTTATRSPALPDVPTIGEFLPGYEASGFFGVGAPKNTPAEIVVKLNGEINAGLADPAMKVRIAELGSVPLPMTPDEFGTLIVESTEKWAKVIRKLGLKVG